VRLYFILVRRVPPVPSPVLLEVFDRLARRGFRIESGIPEEEVASLDDVRVAHDLYLLKSHTELALSLAGVLHGQDARLLNPYPSCITTQNKIVAFQRLRAGGVPVPDAWVTGDLSLLRPVAEHRRLIVKPYLGHRGTGIHVVDGPADLERIPPPTVPVLVQEYIEGTGEDLKLYVVGSDVFAVRKPFSPTSFAVPGRPSAVTRAQRDIARRCGELFGLGLYGLDVIESPEGPFVVDLNYFPGYKGVPDAAARIAAYIERYAVGREELGLEQLAPRSAGEVALGEPLLAEARHAGR
jgi:ribosomal protein S6--L-glutamate ligase